jgi:hypothetical protein
VTCVVQETGLADPGLAANCDCRRRARSSPVEGTIDALALAFPS